MISRSECGACVVPKQIVSVRLAKCYKIDPKLEKERGALLMGKPLAKHLITVRFIPLVADDSQTIPLSALGLRWQGRCFRAGRHSIYGHRFWENMVYGFGDGALLTCLWLDSVDCVQRLPNFIPGSSTYL